MACLREGSRAGAGQSDAPDRGQPVGVEAFAVGGGVDDQVVEEGGDDRVLAGQVERVPAFAESCGVADVSVECGGAVECGEAFAGCLVALLDRAARGEPFGEADLLVGVGAGEFLELGLGACGLALPLLPGGVVLAAVQGGAASSGLSRR